MEYRVRSLTAREILDSRGNPALEADLTLAGGAWARAAVPSGASTGTFEAAELRDGDSRRYLGKGVLKAVQNVIGPIASALREKGFKDQQEFDTLLLALDGTPKKERLGANALLGASMAFAAAAAAQDRRPLYHGFGSKEGVARLPIPLLNVVNGGAHADNPLDFQEFLLVPIGFARFADALQASVETYHHLKSLLKAKGLSISVGDEGGFAPNLRSNEEVLDFLMKGIEKAGYKPGRQIQLALDVAATGFHKRGAYEVAGNRLPSDQMIRLLEKLVDAYPLYSIEDGLAEEDWEGWKSLQRAVGDRVLLIGDDLYVTNVQRLTRGIRERSSNAVLIKLNQIGTVTETLQTIQLAQHNGFACIVSHRSGETEDTFIADLAVGTGVGRIKTGAPCRSERVCKYNRLLRIEEELGPAARYGMDHEKP